MSDEMPKEIWAYEKSPNNLGRYDMWHEPEPEKAHLCTKYTRSDQTNEMQEAIRELRECLEFYANGDYQEGGGIYDNESHEIDYGQRAKKALKGVSDERFYNS